MLFSILLREYVRLMMFAANGLTALKSVHTMLSTLFVPVDSDKIVLQKMPTKDEIIELIKSVSVESIEWIDNSTLRKDAFMHIIYNGDTKDIVALIAKLHMRKKEVETAGKKFSATVSKILKEAEKRVYQEFSYVLNTDEKNIPKFILKYLNV